MIPWHRDHLLQTRVIIVFAFCWLTGWWDLDDGRRRYGSRTKQSAIHYCAPTADTAEPQGGQGYRSVGRWRRSSVVPLSEPWSGNSLDLLKMDRRIKRGKERTQSDLLSWLPKIFLLQQHHRDHQRSSVALQSSVHGPFKSIAIDIGWLDWWIEVPRWVYRAESRMPGLASARTGWPGQQVSDMEFRRWEL